MTAKGGLFFTYYKTENSLVQKQARNRTCMEREGNANLVSAATKIEGNTYRKRRN